ncbi:leader peptidase (prepilin peptidase)/N-methyltransferase [Kroppenstedtia sanguinis]|uniref:Prepilin peptidase n=2 Tax=Kroppenstedtia sanguinis TaxID=1380684 RepID=A0ABW4CAA8_9BACL
MAIVSAGGFYLLGASSLPLEEQFIGGLLLLFLMAAAALDLSWGLIPNRLNGMAALGFLLVHLWSGPEILPLLGAGLLGGGILGIISLLSRGGIGGGDVKMAAAAGLALGGFKVATGLGFAVLSGGLWAFFLLLTGKVDRKTPLPFAPHLAIGFYVSWLWGEELVHSYLSLYS